MSRERKRHTEWKPTAEPWVIDRGFSLFVNNRCVFFHGRSNKWRAAFNFAKCFISPTHIVVLYLYGPVKHESILNALKGVDHQMMVFVLPIDQEDLAAWDSSEAEKKRLSRAGLTRQMIEADYDTAMLHQDIESMKVFAENAKKELDMLDSGEEAEERIRAAQQMPAMVYSTFLPESRCGADHEAFILAVIRDLYPCGVEMNAPSELGSKVLLMKKLVTSALDGKANDAVRKCVGDLDNVQISFFDPPSIGAEQFLNDVQAWCSSQLKENGYFSATDLYAMIFAPPYGYYPCNYYAYLLSRALAPFTVEPYLYRSKIVGIPFSFANREAWLLKPSGIVFIEVEQQKQMRLALRQIFPCEEGIQNQSFCDLHGEIVRAAMGYITEKINTPLACADRRWEEVFRADSDAWCNKNFAIKYHAFLTDIPARKKEVETINHFFDGKYDAEKLRLFYKFYSVKGGAVGWLHSAEDFEERLETYMSTKVCRECGRPFKVFDKKGTVEVAQSNDLKILRFTEKEIIGLNKKFLGRYQDQYFCIHCLCEVLETTPDELKEKEEQFKQQGCTLFL